MRDSAVTLSETQGRIITSVGGLYTVETSRGMCTCKARGVFRKRGILPYVGDFVQLSEDGVICEILPRKNSILRPPVANLDQILFVTSSCRPDPNLLLLDSFLAVAIYQNIQPVLVLTKVDLDAAEQVRRLYTSAGIPVYAVDYRNGETVQAVAALLKDKVSMMTGNSGVGKSTLLNAMEPSLQLPVGEISEKLGRGRHTTRHVELFPLAGGLIADTPGFSAFDQEKGEDPVEQEALARSFREFRPYLGQCRFVGCAHVKEQGCAVLAARDAGKIVPSRHESYVRLYELARENKPWGKN